MKTKKTSYARASVFEQIEAGLKQGIAQARGELTLRTVTLPDPAPTLSSQRVVAIRNRVQMSQGVFASYLNVPTKTLQSWEQGQRRPKAGEARLLQLFEASPDEFVALIAGLKRRTTTRKTDTKRRAG